MLDLKSTCGKHLTLDDRQEIMESLDKGVTFKAIARRIGKDPRTISREVKRHLAIQPLSVSRTKADGTPIDERRCPLLLKAPFVCNPCKKRRCYCSFQKQLYIAKNAQAEYETLLREAREGIPLNKEEFWNADSIIAEGITKGQRLYHIMESNDVSFSRSSAYRHLHRGYLSVSKLDFPRVVKFKSREQRRPDSVPKALREGRTYSDFLAFTSERGITSWVEMNTVIGRIGGKVIMTFDFTLCNFMFGLLLNDKTAVRIIMAMVLMFMYIGGFVLLMFALESEISIAHALAAYANAVFLGGLGILASAICGNAVIGYMAPVLYCVLDLMGSLGSFTMFSIMRSGTMDGKLVLLIIGICCAAASIWGRNIILGHCGIIGAR